MVLDYYFPEVIKELLDSGLAASISDGVKVCGPASASKLEGGGVRRYGWIDRGGW